MTSRPRRHVAQVQPKGTCLSVECMSERDVTFDILAYAHLKLVPAQKLRAVLCVCDVSPGLGDAVSLDAVAS